MKYKFDLPDGQYTEGYAIMIVKDGEAEIDEKDPVQMVLVEKHNGEPVKVAKRASKARAASGPVSEPAKKGGAK